MFLLKLVAIYVFSILVAITINALLYVECYRKSKDGVYPTSLHDIFYRRE
ncbi:hypothetical protein ABC628_05195 [Lentilactobacillus otakiensis]|uniref:Uncharacterized protein n=1 Tax=Lentilactobacillus otakiensis DSM 19908 = JCM 15040 TaxID=1423780 RepID=S4NSY5_9LACO|nr:hypothetical protein [Lentilactobacillus otakiensis]MBZ3776541.1 hypothetical protein [Lentilactobacillus otakiensis]MDV3517390.1 hypothetical protein [Lentilactobacillus otakiensis]GAD17088.1 hypothetical protein LOT_1626 [Lentilactobacillus otakiensis DSM 19908 = JCM 15040]